MERHVYTYSEFLKEGKGEWLDGVRDKEGSFNKIRLDDTDRIRILEFIYEAGNTGRRYTDIVKFIVEAIKGEKYNWKIHRGYGSGQLTGRPGRYWGRGGTTYGLLHKYCDKNESGNWVLTNDKLINHFMQDDFRGVLDDDAKSALRELLYTDR